MARYIIECQLAPPLDAAHLPYDYIWGDEQRDFDDLQLAEDEAARLTADGIVDGAEYFVTYVG